MTAILLDIREVQKVLSVGRSKVYELMDNGAIESVKLGQRRLIVGESIVAFVGSLREAA